MNKIKPVLRTAEEINEIIELWKLSGQTKMAFTREMGINYQTFMGWTKSRASKSINYEQEKFIPLKVESNTLPFAEIHLGSGNKIIFHQAVPAEYFQKLTR